MHRNQTRQQNQGIIQLTQLRAELAGYTRSGTLKIIFTNSQSPD